MALRSSRRACCSSMYWSSRWCCSGRLRARLVTAWPMPIGFVLWLSREPRSQLRRISLCSMPGGATWKWMPSRWSWNGTPCVGDDLGRSSPLVPSCLFEDVLAEAFGVAGFAGGERGRGPVVVQQCRGVGVVLGQELFESSPCGTGGCDPGSELVDVAADPLLGAVVDAPSAFEGGDL